MNITVAGKRGQYVDNKSAQQALNAIDAVISKQGALADVELPGAVDAKQAGGGQAAGLGQGGVKPENLQQIQAEMRQVEARVSRRISAGEAGIPPSREGMAKIFREELDRSKAAGKLPYDFDPGFGSGSGGGIGGGNRQGGWSASPHPALPSPMANRPAGVQPCARTHSNEILIALVAISAA